MRDILIVEDGMQERERLERLFMGQSYSVQACATVGDAEKYLQNETFRVAILDIGLSDKSGSYLFNTIKRGGRVSFIIIFTGNPSVHLKQRFIDEGATDYIVKGSTQALNENLIQRVKEIIGEAQASKPTGIPLGEFMDLYLNPTSKSLFLDMDDSLPACKNCGSKGYSVVFSHQAQVPPTINGEVICAGCGKTMNPEVE